MSITVGIIFWISVALFYIMPLFKFVGIDTDGDGIKDHVDEDDDNKCEMSKIQVK